jgi:hypothetical protein
MCWDADSGQTCAIPPVKGLPAFSPDGRFAAGPDEWFGQQIEVYETAGWKRLSRMGDESQPVHHISFSADGQIVGAEVGYRLRLWETLSGQELVELPDQFIDFQFSPDCRLGFDGWCEAPWSVTVGRPARQALRRLADSGIRTPGSGAGDRSPASRSRGVAGLEPSPRG